MDNINIDAKKIDYVVLKQIQDHAKKYDSSSDKKDFLKKVSAYEQKIILLQSKNPCEVLTYLAQIDTKSTKLVLNELNKNEISKILALFSSADKKYFYSNFSELDLVNQFIAQDKNSSEYIQDLSLERKVDLIDSSNQETIEATSKVYNTMTSEEKDVVVSSVTSPDASTVLNKVQVINSFDETQDNEFDNKQELNIENNLQLEEQIEEKVEELEEEQLEQEENKETLLNEEETNDKKEQIEEKSEILEEEHINTEELEKFSIIGDGSNYVSLVSNPLANKLFEQAKQNCEKIEIENLQQQIVNESSMTR